MKYFISCEMLGVPVNRGAPGIYFILHEMCGKKRRFFCKKLLPLQPMRNMRAKRSISAWLLLSVFLPVLLCSSLHVHDEVPASGGCSECVNHIPHQGHLSLDTIHLNDCLLCHFLSLPFVVAVAVVLTAMLQGYAVAVVQLSDKLRLAAFRLRSPRAPPVVI